MIHYYVTAHCVFNLIISRHHILVSRDVLVNDLACHVQACLCVCCVKILTPLQNQKDSGHEICLLEVNCKYVNKLLRYVTCDSVCWVLGLLSRV
jgi:hypothetical protein